MDSRNVEPEAFSFKGWLFLGLLALLIAIAGGASRYDAIQIVPLRSLAGLLLIPGIYYLSTKDAKKEVFLVGLFVIFALLIAVQLLPLPPSIWQSLSHRSVVVELDIVLGLENTWRPLTMSPMRTWNALGSLVVPLTGLLLAIAFGATSHALLQLVAALGILNAIMALLQIVGGPFSLLYFYALTNRGGAVGIFANENHAAVFAACSMLVVAELGSRARRGPRAGRASIVYTAGYFLILLSALVGGSRAGFAAAMGALLISFAMLFVYPAVGSKRRAADPIRRWIGDHPYFFRLLPVLTVVVTVLAFVTLERSPAFTDLLKQDSFANLRWSLWPVIGDMLDAHWVVGTGFGSFEQVYKIYEPSELLLPLYVNQAHNDWAQFIIEGGIPALALLIGLVAWVGRAITKLAGSQNLKTTALFWFGIFAIFAGASLIDYPLRTPVFQLIGIWLLLALSKDARGMKATP